jgi:hypothetical protein
VVSSRPTHPNIRSNITPKATTLDGPAAVSCTCRSRRLHPAQYRALVAAASVTCAGSWVPALFGVLAIAFAAAAVFAKTTLRVVRIRPFRFLDPRTDAILLRVIFGLAGVGAVVLAITAANSGTC